MQKNLDTTTPVAAGLAGSAQAPGPYVLAVDDESVNRTIVAAVLEPLGYRVIGAASAGEAEQLLRGAAPDVVLLDVMMPGESGVALCRRLRADRAFDGVPIVLLTALGADEHRTAGLQAGADDFVEKPIDFDTLAARVASWTARGRSPQPGRRTVPAGRLLGSPLAGAAAALAPDHVAPHLAAAMARAAGLDDPAVSEQWRP